MTIVDSTKLINDFAKQHSFFEFRVYEYSNDKLVIVGSTDLLYYHTMEIHFINPTFVACKFHWLCDTQKNAVDFMGIEEEYDYNVKNWIEVGFNTVKFIDEDDMAHFVTFERMNVLFETTRYSL